MLTVPNSYAKSLSMLIKNSSNDLWQLFLQHARLTQDQLDQFKLYYAELVETNDIHNLTAITDLQKVLQDHFLDSLAISSWVDFSKLTSLADVGTGAGFPALPLKIVFPHLHLFLIEVNNKKIAFLYTMIEMLNLKNVTIIDVDWRTFLRKTAYDIELFCARASLQPEELIRMFKPSSPYRHAQLVYWASAQWLPSTMVEPFIIKEEHYAVDNKKRRLIFFGLTKNEG